MSKLKDPLSSQVAQSQKVWIRGKTGTGKSHLLALALKKAFAKQITIFTPHPDPVFFQAKYDLDESDRNISLLVGRTPLIARVLVDELQRPDVLVIADDFWTLEKVIRLPFFGRCRARYWITTPVPGDIHQNLRQFLRIHEAFIVDFPTTGDTAPTFT